MQNDDSVMEKNIMKMRGQLNQALTKGTFIRRHYGDLKPNTVFSDCHSQSVHKGKPQQSLALMEGSFCSYKLEDSFILHAGKAKELVDFQVITTAKKSLCITVVLDGKLDFGYDDLNFLFDANHKKRAVMVSLTQEVSFRRTLYKNNQVTKLNIILPHEWIRNRLRSNDNFSYFITKHLAHFELNVNQAMLDLTLEIIQSSSPNNVAEQMQLEILTQRFLIEVLMQLNHANNAIKEQNLSDQSSEKNNYDPALDKLISYIERNLDKEMSVKHLASFAAMSASSLQHKFKSSLGISVLSYIRRRRLNIAKQQLEAGFITISEAAYNAGYRHPSNFTNAFKKTFGLPPQDLIVKEEPV